MDKEEAKHLFEKYVAGKATDAEKALLESWYLQWKEDAPSSLTDSQTDQYLSELQKRNPYLVHSSGRGHRFWLLKVAAVFLIAACLTAVMLFYSGKDRMPARKIAQVALQPVPGDAKAVLTLGDGKTINLSQTTIGTVFSDKSGSRIRKTKEGVISYTQIAPGLAKGMTYNTITTLHGGTYTVNLPDGSVAILNAASSLRYPTVFAGKERKVQLTGEAYFTVIHDASRPFEVETGSQLIEDLGTEFNVAAYADDPSIKTTLIRGSVRVTKGTQSAVLRPGQQAVSSDDTRLAVVQDADIEEAIAWKMGFFKFSGEPIDRIMKKVSRWYNVKVVYGPNVTKEGFYGTISRNSNIKEVLDMLGLTGLVHFKMQGNEIAVEN